VSNEKQLRSASPALELLLRQRSELQAVLARHGIPVEEAPWLVTEALLAVGPEPAAPLSGGRLLRALDVVCTRWALDVADGRQAPGDLHSDDAFGTVLRTVARRLDARRNRLTDEDKAAPKLVDEIVGLSPAERQRSLAEHRFRSWAVVDRLLALATGEVSERPHRSLALALLAGEIADRLDPADYGASALRDLRARAAMKSANAQRVLGKLRAAEEGFDRAERLLEEGSLDPRLRAEHLRLKAALHRARRQLDDAERLLDQAMAIHRWAGDRERQVRVLNSKSLLHEHRGTHEAGVAVCRQARSLLADMPPSRLHLTVLHNLASHQLRLGRAVEAAELLPAIDTLANAHGGSNDRLRIDWLRGLVELALGDASGEERLATVRQGFVDDSQPFGAALVSLDLAAVYLASGRTKATRRLADEMVPLFRSMQVHREALAAVLVFRQAVELEKATVGLAREVARSLRDWQDRAGVVRPS